MKVIKETFYGTVKFRVAVFDTDGTNLQDGVEVLIDDSLVAELQGERLSKFEEMSEKDVEKFLEENNYV